MRICSITVLMALVSIHADELSMRAPLQPEKLIGCVLSEGKLRLPDPLPTQVGGAPICVEAESLRTVRWQGDSGAVTEAADAAGAKCIAFVSEAVYHFSVTRAGYYTYWQRAWIPRKASWSHNVQIDDAIPMSLAFGLRKADRGQTWFWIKGARHYLKRGVHTLAIRNLHNGKRLDRWVLTTIDDSVPQGTGPQPTSVKEIAEGEFISASIEPLSLKRWVRLGARVKGQAQVEVCAGEAAFRSLPPDGRLDGPAQPLRVRVSMHRGADGISPEVALGSIHYVAEAREFHVLRNPALEMILHRSTGRICGLRDARTGRRYLPDGLPSTLFEIETKRESEAATSRLLSDDAVLTDTRRDGQKITLVYALADAKLTATVTIDLTHDWMARLGLHLKNSMECDIIAVAFPQLHQASAGADGTDDVLCFPSMSGRLIPRPGRAGTVTNQHPIRTTIGFCDLHDERGGLTLAPLDCPMVLTDFRSAADPGGQSTTLSLTRRDRVRASGQAQFAAGVGLHEGDWHVAADWYREWFARNVGRPQIPAWVHDSDGWVTSANVEEMAGLGFRHIQLWRNTGYGGCPTYYYPNPRYRSEEKYKELARRWRALDGHLGVYFHGNGMSRSYLLADKIYGISVSDIPAYKRPPSWDWFVKNHGYGPERKPIEKLDMSKIAEPAKHEEYPRMCWQAGEWYQYLRKWGIDIFLKEYGLDTPYWDTLGCIDRPDFSPFYGHHGEGRGAMARYRFLLDTQKLGARVSPGFYQIVEGGSELLGLVAGQLESNFVKNLEVARYTHPDQVYYVGHSNGWWTSPKCHLAACMAFYLNTKFDLIRLWPNIMAVVRCRRWFAPWLYHSRFMDHIGLSLTTSKIKGALHVHRSSTGDALIATFMNWQRIQGERATIDLRRHIGENDARAYLVTQDTVPEALPGGKRTFDIPASPVCAVLFLADPSRARPVVQAWQAAAKQRVQVFDPSGKKRNFKMRFKTAEARLKGNQGSDLVVLSPSLPPATYGEDFEYVQYEKLSQRVHAAITLTDGDLTLQTRSLVKPHFADPDFEDERFDATEAHTGQRSLKITPAGKLRHFPLELIPGHRYRVSVWVKRLETVGQVYANVHRHRANVSHAFGGRLKPNEWTKIETTYDMKHGVTQPHLYLYNWQGTTKPAWFDTVEVVDLGETPRR